MSAAWEQPGLTPEERAKEIAEGVGVEGYFADDWTAHSVNDAEAIAAITAAIRAAVREAVAKEREACAALADRFAVANRNAAETPSAATHDSLRNSLRSRADAGSHIARDLRARAEGGGE